MTSRRILPAVVAAIVYFLLDASEAFAWGPAMHVSLATEVLRQGAMLPAAIAGLITRYASDYIYGNLAADVVFAKRLSRIKQFCHHWSTGFSILDRAQDDRQRAFAYGYLSHLAADTVAHGKYVPRQVAVSATTVNFGHLYWEVRADLAVGPNYWLQVNRVVRGDFQPHHELLETLLTDTFLPFQANRGIFTGMSRLTSMPSWHRTVEAWGRRSRLELPTSLVEAYRAESLERIRCLLCNQERSPVLQEDPNGTAALEYLRLHRRQLRHLRRRGLPHAHTVWETASAYAPAPWLPVPPAPALPPPTTPLLPAGNS